MADISKIKLPDNSEYDIKSLRTKYTELIPEQSKTFSGVIASANTDPGGWLYYGNVKPTNYYTPWRIKLRMKNTIAGLSSTINSKSYFVLEITGLNNTYYGYHSEVLNNSSYRSIYAHVIYCCTPAGITNGYGHLLGIRLQSAYNPTTTANSRTVEIEILETENCTFTFHDSMILYANAPGTGKTNYVNRYSFDGTTSGHTMAGDRNSTSVLYHPYFTAKAGSNGIFVCTFMMQQPDGTWESIVTSSSYITDKAANTHGFLLDHVLFNYSNGNTSGGAIMSTSRVSNLVDLWDMRYTFNGITSTASTSAFVVNKPLYLVGSVSGGLFYVDTTKWFAQDLPSSDDGKIYIFLGVVYDAYRAALTPHQPKYWYKNGAIRIYGDYGKTIASDVPANADMTAYTGTSPISINNHVVSHANSGVTAASKGDTSNQTPGFGSTFKALSGTVNATGHLTSFADHTVKIPDTKASTSAYGITKLSTSTSSTATDLAATPSAVKIAKDRADEAYTKAATVESGLNGTLIYDHSYTISNGVATFTPHVYLKGEEVTSNYAKSCFVWKYKLANDVTGTPSYIPLTTNNDRTCTVTISVLGYGGYVLGEFTPA